MRSLDKKNVSTELRAPGDPIQVTCIPVLALYCYHKKIYHVHSELKQHISIISLSSRPGIWVDSAVSLSQFSQG